MSEAGSAVDARASSQKLVQELKVSGHLMNLDAGLFCIVQTPAPSSDPSLGLPGVRVSLPPGAASRPDAVTIKSFRDDGWLRSQGDAALVRVEGGPAQILVTVYQAHGVSDPAPNIQVLRLIEPVPAQQMPALAAAPLAIAQQPAPAAAGGAPQVMDMVAHIMGRGDVGGMIGDWLGERGGKRWIEGFALAPQNDITPKDIEYQAVLGRGWMSPWVEGGQYCGSRGMALPILGIRVRLKGAAAEKFDVSYAASFVDGSATELVAEGEACESENLAAVEAFKIVIHPKGTPAEAAKPAKRGAKPVPATPPPTPAPAPAPARATAKAEPAAKPKPAKKPR